MNRSIILALTTVSIFIICGCSQKKEYSEDNFLEKKYQSFNLDWKFILDSTSSYEAIDIDDSNWRSVDLPHDWSIEHQKEFEAKYTTGIFSKESPGGESTGHVLGGIGWYRKTFFVDEKKSNKIYTINFDGVYMLSDVFVNGELVGSHFNGYTPFSYNITDYIKPGTNNVIAVKVKNLGENSRWYSGSGIYRDVTMIVTEPVYFGDNDVFVTTPNVSNESATVNLAMMVRNESDEHKQVKINSLVINPSGDVVQDKEIQKELITGINKIEDEIFSISTPDLWSIETPELYTLQLSIYSGKELLDKYSLQFGIRSLFFSAEEGFLLNGKPILLKGTNIHHDNGLLGSKTFYRAEERKVEILKANGFNAIRTSHNPPSKNLLDVCDRLGMLVMDEAFDAWERAKKAQDYSVHFKENWKQDLESIIYRDRNHPCVIMWSIGNEINERADTSGVRIARQLTETIKAIDTTRPITAGICGFWDHPGREWETVHDAFKYLDVAGYNYKYEEYIGDHKKFPQRIIAGTESIPLDVYSNWHHVKTLPYVIGDFVWTGMDYIGESGIGHINYNSTPLLMPWPWYNAWCGDIDLIGDKKPQSYYRDVVWEQSRLEMAVHYPLSKREKGQPSYWGFPDEYQNWTWPGCEGEKLLVTTYSSCEKVRIILNGKTIEEKLVTDTNKLKLTFEVPYEPGELKAIGITNGKEVAEKILETTGKPKKIKLEVDSDKIKADRKELSFITISILDEEGNLVTNNDIKIKVSVTGAGELIASGNGAPDDMESFNNPEINTFRGRALAIVRPLEEPGEIKFVAKSEGLPETEITIVSN